VLTEFDFDVGLTGDGYDPWAMQAARPSELGGELIFTPTLVHSSSNWVRKALPRTGTSGRLTRSGRQ